MDSWIPALSTALQHSIQNVIFLSFQIWISGNTWPQCTVKFTRLLFSLLCKNLRTLVFLSRQWTKWMRILKYKDKGWRLKWRENVNISSGDRGVAGLCHSQYVWTWDPVSGKWTWQQNKSSPAERRLSQLDRTVEWGFDILFLVM